MQIHFFYFSKKKNKLNLTLISLLDRKLMVVTDSINNQWINM